ncbi:MAG: hypothetical protein J5792_06975 [Bacteroidales bacterium]|nr:hypothetical protein [Bacteroidales bacterium]
MQELKDLTEDIQKKSAELVKLYKRSVEENISLKSKNKELRNKVGTLEAKIKEQAEQIVKLQMLKFLGEETNRKEAKMKLNELVREIDHCLQLLEV